jgi:hypothetical protein
MDAPYITGFADVQKLGEAALIGPEFANAQTDRRGVFNFNITPTYQQLDTSGKLYYKPCPGSTPQCRPLNSLPPARATFLSFGFMPTSATLQVTQVGTLNIATLSLNNFLTVSEVDSMATIRVENVTVNGVPLNVGSNCHTATPFALKLIGNPSNYALNPGGVLTGTIDVPPFTGYGVGENLDSIFTSSVSGPGNVKVTQGTLCSDWPAAEQPAFCPPTVPKPIR